MKTGLQKVPMRDLQGILAVFGGFQNLALYKTVFDFELKGKKEFSLIMAY
jgi:hypothetical protein